MNNDFDTIGAILRSKQFSNINSDYSVLINNWADIIGKVYSEKSMVSSISNKNNKTILYINVKSATVIQDLSFYKKNILYKIKSKFNISIDEIIFKVKDNLSYDKTFQVKPSVTQKTYYENPTEEDISAIELDEEELSAIKKFEEIKFLDEEKKKKTIELIIRDLKSQKWMKKQGYPICKNCGKIVRFKNFNEEVYCEACKYLLKNKKDN